jgi:hypothetical protein
VCAVVAFVDDGDGDEPTDRSLIPGVAAGEDDRWTNLGWDNVVVCTVCPYEMGWQQNLSLDTTQPGLGVRSVFGFFFPFSSFASPDRVDPSDTACLRW